MSLRPSSWSVVSSSSFLFYLILIVFIVLLVGVLVYPRYQSLRGDSCVVKDVPYPIAKQPYTQPDLGSVPKAGIQKKISQCFYFSVLMDPSWTEEERQTIFESHDLHHIPGSKRDPLSFFPSPIPKAVCDQDCHDVFLTQLYESFLIKKSLEDFSFSGKVMAVFHKIFQAVGQKLDKQNGPGTYEAIIQEWSSGTSHNYYPVSQQNRSLKDLPASTLLTQLAGIRHDPTEVLLAGNFMKMLSNYLPADYLAIRNYSFNCILKRLRGYRTNQFNRRDIETQIGIVNVNYPDLELRQNYYKTRPWLHPGRSQCDVDYLQGTYQHEAMYRGIPLECGISGSTNFWLWTIAWANVSLTKEEAALLIYSAFLVLGADGGHSLNEVLSTAAITALFWRDYETYSKDPTFRSSFQSEFSRHLLAVTQQINPIGPGPFLCIDADMIAHRIFHRKCYTEEPKEGSSCYYFFQSDSKSLSPQEIQRRQELEAFFTLGRRQYRMGDYRSFLNEISDLSPIRQSVFPVLKAYAQKYCTPRHPIPKSG